MMGKKSQERGEDKDAVEMEMSENETLWYLKMNKINCEKSTLENETIFIEQEETRKISTHVTAADKKQKYMKNFGINIELPSKYFLNSKINKLMPQFSF